MPRKLLGKTCGILPLGVESAYVKTTGLEWDLREFTRDGNVVQRSTSLQMQAKSDPFSRTRSCRRYTKNINGHDGIYLKSSCIRRHYDRNG